MTTGNRPDGTESRTEGLELIMERYFDAPRERLFEMYVNPEHVREWWGPEGWTTENRRMEVEEGGVWHYVMRSSDGQESWGKAVYREISKPDRIVYLDMFSDEQGTESTEMPEMLITVEFIEEDGGTILRSRTRFQSEEELRSVKDMGAVEGMTESLDRLERKLNESKSA